MILMKENLRLMPQQFNNYPPIFFMRGHKDVKAIKTTESQHCIFYVHIPFCLQKCTYCVLSSLIKNPKAFENTLGYVEKEIGIIVSQFGRRKIAAAMYGGGTPSNLSSKQIAGLYGKIYKSLNFETGAEITAEIRPATFDLDKLKAFIDCGVNRLSFGVQTLNPTELQYCGRQNTYDVVASSMELAYRAGFNNINFDIIYGLPKQTPASFQETCKQIFAKLKPQHVCLYLLIVHPGAAIANLKKIKPEIFPSERDKQQMFDIFIEIARQHEYINTSVENVAQSNNLFSRYQRLNWQGLERIGVGPEAIGFVNQCQYVNFSYGQKYRQAVGQNRLPIDFSYKLNSEEMLIRKIILGLHNLKIKIDDFEREFSINIEKKFSKQWEYLKKNNFIVKNGKEITLSDKGMKFFFFVQSQFFSDEIREKEIKKVLEKTMSNLSIIGYPPTPLPT
ncbi:hypothetical protein A2V95_00520 [Candidatus Kuenenbacteria bacterium RBG_16_41_7]|uniref:Radical SAM core domain-containing protein n=1 Tax=Candidatus Kuenenbacteria bacterium RBG_16_41_7 TaxID=1798560 RepID=A0A1F6GCR8_9BACT|nr:MAG: hypothetical protein A2V95_00520 [Candidatus Kuenenbacteria bacterium RBG_16_41_7]